MQGRGRESRRHHDDDGDWLRTATLRRRQPEDLDPAPRYAYGRINACATRLYPLQQGHCRAHKLLGEILKLLAELLVRKAAISLSLSLARTR